MISEVKKFEKSFDILDSLSSDYINAQLDTQGFEVLGKYLKIIKTDSLK